VAGMHGKMQLESRDEPHKLREAPSSRHPEPGAEAPAPRPRKVEKQSTDAVSVSLRKAYDSAVEEEIPEALMDLLRKLD